MRNNPVERPEKGVSQNAQLYRRQSPLLLIPGFVSLMHLRHAEAELRIEVDVVIPGQPIGDV